MISIIVPIFNAAEYLTDCVDSILGQTTAEPLQIILVDDSSTDNSLVIAKSYAKKHAEDPRRQVLLLTQPHSGQSIARNLGLQYAEGEYIAFVDSDDRIAPDWCDRHLSAIKGVDYVQSGYRRTSDALTESGWHVGIRRLPKHQYNYTSPCMRLYRRSALRGLQFEGGVIYEDVIFSTELWLSGATCRRIDYAGYLYTKNPASTTSVPHPDAQKRVLDELRNRIPMASWKGKLILWYTIFRLKIHFIMEVRKQMDPDFAMHKRTAMLLLLTACCMAPFMASAATYFASPEGNGDGSSYLTPTTFSDGVSKLSQPGDTLYLLEGTYYFTDKFSINKQGSKSKNIVISGYPGEKVTLDFHKVAYGTRGITVHANSLYVHIKDLAIAWSGKNNLYNEGSFCLFENLDIYGSADTGCQMKKGGNNIIKNVDSHDNFDYETMKVTTANFGGNADGFADKQFTGAGNHYIGCRAWGNSDDGWDFFQRVSTSNTIIENCICYQNGPAYYDMSKNPRATGVDKAWFDSKAGTQMIDRYGNTITISLEKYPCQGNGNGFKMGGEGTNHKILIHHCLAVANNARGFDQNNNGGTMWVYNNSAYTNNVNFGFTTAYGTNSLQNNVSLNGKNADDPKSKTVAANDHNTWNSGFNCSASDFLSLDTTQILAPRAEDGSLAEGTFMRLAEGSKLIDAGTDINLGYNGSAPDLGCYETAGEHHDPIPDDTIPEVQPEGSHAVAFVTTPQCAEDKALLSYLRQNDSLWIVETDANDNSVDYSQYEVVVLGSKPNSGAIGFAPLKGYDKPMVLLKPFLLKAGVWGWGTAVNTQDLSVLVNNSAHPLFEGVSITDGELQLFSQCATNAVTAISTWTATEGVETLASPVTQTSSSSIAILPAGTDCNGTVLPQRMVMIGVSEYSTTYLTNDGKRLIENAICYQLGIENTHSQQGQAIEHTKPSNNTSKKFIHHGQLFIQSGDYLYDGMGRRIDR
ncbi:MAG: glycosyltransferase [Paludibacteraceae bacterium]|nr:glycosyltransferase [Paludibacteraceae bacterium]